MRPFILLGPILVHAVPLWQRDLVGLLGDSGLNQASPNLDSTTEIALAGLTSTSATTRIRQTAHTSREGATTLHSPVTPPPQPPTFATSSAEINTALEATTAAWTMSTPFPTAPTPTVPEAPTTSAEEATQWKVIGIGIITVGLIATVILSIIFFDAWWNFLCDLVCGRRRKRVKNQGQETMISDSETRDWEFKLANEDGHRYPTMSSLADITEGRKAPRDLKLVAIPGAAMLSPKPAFLLDLNPTQDYSGEPLARRPSSR